MREGGGRLSLVSGNKKTEQTAQEQQGTGSTRGRDALHICVEHGTNNVRSLSRISSIERWRNQFAVRRRRRIRRREKNENAA
jgi:Na+-translocating ferredoxin:NAD+ oxidoreductase RNF subunit RnfB